MKLLMYSKANAAGLYDCRGTGTSEWFRGDSIFECTPITTSIHLNFVSGTYLHNQNLFTYRYQLKSIQCPSDLLGLNNISNKLKTEYQLAYQNIGFKVF